MSNEKMELQALAKHLALVYSERLASSEQDSLSDVEEEDLPDALRYLELRGLTERAKRGEDS